jgi:hypothetical protein
MGRWSALLAAALFLTACTTTGGSPASPDAPVVPVPPAQPAGGAYGRLMDADGNSVPGGAVTLTQPFDDNIVLLSVRLVSLGTFCLIPDAGLCPSAHGADVSDDGLWSVPADEVEEGKALSLGGRGLAPEGGLGAFTSVSVPNGRPPVHVPDIVLWQPEVRVAGNAVTWPALTGVPTAPGSGTTSTWSPTRIPGPSATRSRYGWRPACAVPGRWCRAGRSRTRTTG